MLYCENSVGLIWILLVVLFFIRDNIVLVVVFRLLFIMFCSVVGILKCWVLFSICFSFFLGMENDIKYRVFCWGFLFCEVCCLWISLFRKWLFECWRGFFSICFFVQVFSWWLGFLCSCLFKFFCCFRNWWFLGVFMFFDVIIVLFSIISSVVRDFIFSFIIYFIGRYSYVYVILGSWSFFLCWVDFFWFFSGLCCVWMGGIVCCLDIYLLFGNVSVFWVGLGMDIYYRWCYFFWWFL